MLIKVKKTENGYIKIYDDGSSASTAGEYDDEVKEFINGGGVVADEFTAEELIANAVANYKSIYLEIVNKKLADLDYDSLNTVQLWEYDAKYGVEATKILTWYKAIIAKNYELLDAGVMLSDEDYIAQINAIIF